MEPLGLDVVVEKGSVVRCRIRFMGRLVHNEQGLGCGRSFNVGHALAPEGNFIGAKVLKQRCMYMDILARARSDDL